MCKAICGVAAGATGGIFNLYWASKENTNTDIADIQAKFGAQHTVTGSLGLIFAAFFARYVADYEGYKLWILYTVLTVLHLYANTECMKLIVMNTINTCRLDILIQQFLKQQQQQQIITKEENNDNNNTTGTTTISLLDPVQMARKEPLFFIRRSKISSSCRILFGAAFDQHSTKSGLSSKELKDTLLLSQQQEQPYIITSNRKKKKLIVVSLAKTATSTDTMKAYLHATILCDCINNNNQSTTTSSIIEGLALRRTQTYWPIFQQCLQNEGWDLNQIELQSLGYIYSV